MSPVVFYAILRSFFKERPPWTPINDSKVWRGNIPGGGIPRESHQPFKRRLPSKNSRPKITHRYRYRKGKRFRTYLKQTYGSFMVDYHVNEEVLDENLAISYLEKYHPGFLALCPQPISLDLRKLGRYLNANISSGRVKPKEVRRILDVKI